jgi:hypothetical protein
MQGMIHLSPSNSRIEKTFLILCGAWTPAMTRSGALVPGSA